MAASAPQSVQALAGALVDPDPWRGTRRCARLTIRSRDVGRSCSAVDRRPHPDGTHDAGARWRASPPSSYPPEAHAEAALAEWRDPQNVDADRPEARLNLCARDAGTPAGGPAAEAPGHAALRLAPPPRPGSPRQPADVERALGREDAARATLRRGTLEVAPATRRWHLRGLRSCGSTARRTLWTH
jgi:hypothetical protein